MLLTWHDDTLDPGPLGSNDLFLQAAHWPDLPREGHLASHAQVRRNRLVQRKGQQRRHHCHARRGAILRHQGTTGVREMVM